MAARVTSAEVAVLTGETVSAAMDLAIVTANTLVDSHLLGVGLTDAVLKIIELYLSGHFLLLSVENGPLAKKMVGDANEGYHNVYKAGFLSTRFGQQAVVFDTSNVLSEISSKAENPDRKSALFEVVGTSANPYPW